MRPSVVLAIGLCLTASAAGLGQGAAPPDPRSLAYVLQAEGLGASRQEAVQRLADCGRDWIVVDASFDGSAEGEYTTAEIGEIRAGRENRQVLVYLSIGEAEDYRPYWKREWDADRNGRPDATAPPWLGDENPDWKGNYRVRYWERGWQEIVLALVDRAIEAGFDGVYLDIVDAFESFEYEPARGGRVDHRLNPETGGTYREDMIRWVRRIATRAREQKPGSLVIPQNAAQLLEDAGYLATIDGIGIEDLFTDGDRPQTREHTQYVVGFLDRLKGTGKPTLVIEYGTQPAQVRTAVQRAEESGYVWLVTDRDLKTLGRSGSLDVRSEIGVRSCSSVPSGVDSLHRPAAPDRIRRCSLPRDLSRQCA